MKSKLGANKVAVFIKPTCPYCQEAIELLKKYTFKPGHLEFIDLTARNDMSSIQDYFLQSTGARTVSFCWVFFSFSFPIIFILQFLNLALVVKAFTIPTDIIIPLKCARVRGTLSSSSVKWLLLLWKKMDN